MRDQRVWSVIECAETFRRSVTELKQQLANMPITTTSDSVPSNDNCTGPPAMLVWDKVIDILTMPLDRWSVFTTYRSYHCSFSALMLLVGLQEEHLDHKN